MDQTMTIKVQIKKEDRESYYKFNHFLRQKQWKGHRGCKREIANGESTEKPKSSEHNTSGRVAQSPLTSLSLPDPSIRKPKSSHPF